MKKLIIIFFMAIALNLLSGSVDDHSSRLIIGSEPDYPPYCLINSAGEAEGFSIDLIKAALEARNLDYQITVDLWSKLKLALAKGEIDALPLVGRTPEREALYDFTFPYISLHGAIFVRDNEHRIKSLSDLKDKEIMVMSGDNAEEYARRAKLSNKIFTTNTFQEAFKLLSAGEHDAVITQRVMGIQLLNDLKINNIKPLDVPLDDFRQDFCFAVQEGNKELLEKLNEGLAIIISNGEFDEIYQKWFSPVIDRTLSQKARIRQAAYIFIPIILLAFIVMIIFMRREIKRKTADLRAEIDNREIARQELAASEQKFQSYVDKAPSGIFVANENGFYIDVNKAASEITGYSRIELIGMNLIDLIDPADREKAENSFNQVSETGNTSTEMAFITKSGERRFWHVVATRLTEDTFLGFTLDTTDKRNAQQELKDNRDLLQNLFDNMISGFAYHKIILDESGKPVDYEYIEINHAFEKILGIKKENVVGKKVTEVLPGIENDPADWIGKYGRIALNLGSVQFDNYSQEVKKWFSINAYSYKKGYFVTIFTDITEQRNIEEKLLKYQENLEELIMERTSELEKSNSELVRYNKLFIGREFRIKELRDKVKELEKKLAEN